MKLTLEFAIFTAQLEASTPMVYPAFLRPLKRLRRVRANLRGLENSI